MCCGPRYEDVLPDAIRRMLDGYQQLQADEPWDWGKEWRTRTQITHMIIPARFPPVLAPLVSDRPELLEVSRRNVSEADALRACFESVDPPPGVSFVRLGSSETTVRSGPPAAAIENAVATHWLVVDLESADELYLMPVSGTANATDARIDIQGQRVDLHNVVDRRPAAVLALHSEVPARWSVQDDTGGAWFPDNGLRKWDTKHRPFFHGRDCELTVPAGEITVAVARGLEYEREEQTLTLTAGERRELLWSPTRRIDPAATGWYGADLHVHPHYSGDLIVRPGDLARMQAGEGLHLMSVVAGNLTNNRIYDREAFESTVGEDLPWSDEAQVARYGIEYRNDLLGHFHSLGPSEPPERYQTGHVEALGQEDWPVNALAAAEQRRFGATVGYAHPVWFPFSADGAPDSVFELSFRGARSVEARELVVDAAFGVVDSIDLMSYSNWEAAAQLYYHLLGCGIRLAASVGTDVFLSISHGFNSDPPGWARMYAHLGDQPLSVEAYKAAIRHGRTIATNGPWLELSVDGQGPGSALDVSPGTEITLRATATGPSLRRLELVGPQGVIAAADASNGGAQVEVRMTAVDATWVAARCFGDDHPSLVRGPAYAHTSAVYIDVAGKRVNRKKDAAWCLDWLDRLAKLVSEHGRYHVDEHKQDVLDTIAAARVFYELRSRGG